MKKLFAILALVAALLIVNSASAQTINNDSTQIEDINLRLDNYSHLTATGNALITTGAVVTAGGYALLASESKGGYSAYSSFNTGVPLMVIGGVTSFIGTIINSVAHRKLRSKKFNTRYNK